MLSLLSVSVLHPPTLPNGEDERSEHVRQTPFASSSSGTLHSENCSSSYSIHPFIQLNSSSFLHSRVLMPTLTKSICNFICEISSFNIYNDIIQIWTYFWGGWEVRRDRNEQDAEGMCLGRILRRYLVLNVLPFSHLITYRNGTMLQVFCRLYLCSWFDVGHPPACRATHSYSSSYNQQPGEYASLLYYYSHFPNWKRIYWFQFGI